MNRLSEHLKEAILQCGNRDWFAIGLCGSQNYGLADENSDIDSKFLVIPSFDDIVFNKKPISHTHIMENDEHVDLKDLREYLHIFRKQNINFVEILFTPYFIANPKYVEYWEKLRKNRELLARMNPDIAVSCMKGMAHQKLEALQHPYPSKVEILNKFDYDPKQLHHIIRLQAFLREYIKGTSYEKCLVSGNKDFMLNVKREGLKGFSTEATIKYAKELVEDIDAMVDSFKEKQLKMNHPVGELILNNVLKGIMTEAMKEELS